MKRLIYATALTALLCASAATGQTVKCPASRDVWLSAMGAEKNYNMGAAKTIKLKVWQEFGLVDFDVSALAGKRVKEAFLYVKPAGGHKLGLNAGTDLRWLTLSTVSQEWVEGKSASYATDADGGGATFLESSYQRRNWGFAGSKAWDVILGNGNTLRFDGRTDPASGWLKLKIDPDLVRAMLAGATHGLLVMDGSTTVGVNCRIFARESGNGPYLEVVTAGEDKTPPPAPGALKVAPAPNWATPELGAATISLKVPAGAFAWRVKINDKPLARWQIPFPTKAGQVQSFPVLDLPPGAKLKVEVAAVDAAGNVSAYATAAGAAGPELTVPKLPDYPFKPKGGDPKRLGNANVWAFPEITKLDPVTGDALNEKVIGDIRRKNAVWDGASGTVRLAAARGEIVSFQIAVEGEISGCKLDVSDLAGPGKIPNAGVKLWRNWYVGRHAEYALPLTGGFDCPAGDNEIGAQKLQAVTVDYHVPTSTKAGDYAGAVTLTAGDDSLKLDLKVKVYDVVIPDQVSFNPELNCYSGPGRAGSKKFAESFRLAHYHRCTINRVPYSQGGRVHDDWIPKIAADGRVTDWSAFDANLGSLLDGSLFKDNPRSGVPVPSFYLPLFEGWPKDFRKHYNPGKGVPVAVKDPDQKLRHDTLAKPVEESFDRAYKNAFVNCTRAFVDHAKEKGWNDTIFEFYLNNKPNWGYTVWTLDEPFEYLDWAAINFFGELYKKGIADPEVYDPKWHREFDVKGLAGMKRKRPTFLYRGDISRPMWQGNVSDGLMNMMYIGGAAASMPRLIRNTKVRGPIVLYLYGSCNAVGQSNWQSAAWCLKALALNADGVLPWQSLGGAGAMRKRTTTALIIDTGRYGQAVASFRVHALRRGAQDCELLRMLQRKNGWSREHLGLLISQKVPLTATFRQQFLDEAAAISFGTLTAQGFCELKEGVLQLLEKNR